MGKDLQDGAYKKTYNGEYVTSYKDASLQKKLYDERRREYEIVSKKLNKQEYVNPGRPTSTDHVNPAGVDGKVDTSAKAKVEDVRPASRRQTPPPYVSEEGVRETTITAKPSQIPPAYKTPVASKQPQKRREGDYSYIDLNSTKHPVAVSGKDQYKDIYTNEVINASQARDRLAFAGYKPKMLMPLGKSVLFSLFALLVPFFGPLVLFSIASSMKKKELMDMVRYLPNYSLTFSLPASQSEKELWAKRGTVYTVLSVIYGFIQFQLLRGVIY